MRYVLLALIILMAVAPSRVLADTRVALVIGNSAYRHTSYLRNPTNDADDVAAALKRLSFETILGTDLDKAGMEDAAIRFARLARDADVALFYYAGHAMQFGGVNYLMPVDAKLADEADLRRMVRVDDIVVDLKQAHDLRILVLDACRDNPIAEEFKRSIGRARAATVERGLARIDSVRGMIVSYATQAGQTADDGQSRNSPYTTAFLRRIEAPDEIGTIFRRITADVYKSTRRKQFPELSLSMIGEFYFRGQQVAPAIPAPTSVPSSLMDADANARRDYEFAERAGMTEAWDAFLARYPSGYYADLARAQRNKLTAAVPPVRPTAPIPSTPQPVVGVFPSGRTAHPLLLQQERSLKQGDMFRECDVCPEMVVVPVGSFVMGSPETEPERDPGEAQHKVTFANSFVVGRFAVTFDEWDACANEGGCNGYKPKDRGWGRGLRPVIYVSWRDAKDYVTWLSHKTGKSYRLLTEAEREYVARAGTVTPFWWGTSISTEQANYDGNATYGGGSRGEYRQTTVPGDSFRANPWGLYQVHGNIWEWTEDCWHESYRGAPSDGSAWLTGGDCNQHVHRGGSWFGGPAYLRAAARDKESSAVRHYMLGFRVARTLAH
jgi:formylglycine-generating enzyme required for sulfatase activity